MKGKRLLQDEGDQEVDDDSQGISELESLESLLKIAGCINMELIPGAEISSSKKEFNWSLNKLDEEDLAMQISFDNPETISIDAPDSIKIIFQKSDYFI